MFLIASCARVRAGWRSVRGRGALPVAVLAGRGTAPQPRLRAGRLPPPRARTLAGVEPPAPRPARAARPSRRSAPGCSCRARIALRGLAAARRPRAAVTLAAWLAGGADRRARRRQLLAALPDRARAGDLRRRRGAARRRAGGSPRSSALRRRGDARAAGGRQHAATRRTAAPARSARYVRVHARPGDTQYVMYARANLVYYTGLPSARTRTPGACSCRAKPGAIPRLRRLLGLAAAADLGRRVAARRTAGALDPHGATRRLIARPLPARRDRARPSDLARDAAKLRGSSRRTGKKGRAWVKPRATTPAWPRSRSGALGVVFGDIGTSPLYALQTVFAADEHAVRPTRGGVYGVISLVFWAITLIVSIKYVDAHHARRQRGRGRDHGADRADPGEAGCSGAPPRSRSSRSASSARRCSTATA